MVNAASFREKNPNYFFPRLGDKSSEGYKWLWGIDSEDASGDDSSETGREVQRQKIPCSTEDLLVYSETVYAFCFQRKRWGRYWPFLSLNPIRGCFGLTIPPFR